MAAPLDSLALAGVFFGFLKICQVMLGECAHVSGRISLEQLVEEKVLSGAQHYFFVDEDGCLQGIFPLKVITALPRKAWG